MSWVVEQTWHRLDGRVNVLVRRDGGQHLQVSIPATLARGDDMERIVEQAITRLRPPLGPNTKPGVDEL